MHVPLASLLACLAHPELTETRLALFENVETENGQIVVVANTSLGQQTFVAMVGVNFDQASKDDWLTRLVRWQEQGARVLLTYWNTELGPLGPHILVSAQPLSNEVVLDARLVVRTGTNQSYLPLTRRAQLWYTREFISVQADVYLEVLDTPPDRWIRREADIRRDDVYFTCARIRV